ncbi:STAS domain-containing protein [Sphingomonas sp. DT-51]|uniref:STAS domain-containing protein n=1 Tax=Sphingomonas sp. DT-51 TaxID=3396165 RepID=UPI003F1BC259
MTTVIVADSDLSLSTIQPLRDALSDALAAGAPVQLDLGAVAAPGVALLQLVESARRQATRDGVAFALTAPAAATLRDVLERAGFVAAFDQADHAFWFHGDSSQ